MAMQVQITYAGKIGSSFRIGFVLVPSGSYVAGGDTVNFTTAIADPDFVGTIPQVEALGPPINFDVWSDAGNTAVGYFAVEGTTQANCKVKVVTAFNTEASAGLYSSVAASVLTDSIVGEASFNAL
jgi:hypothetical protein